MIVWISVPSLRQRFHPCEANYVAGTCKARCCEGTVGIAVAVLPSEAPGLTSRGAVVEPTGFLRPGADGRCPFKTAENLCGIHGPSKPLGCRASPFILTSRDTLVVRNRYRRLRCYACDGSLPAYEAHRWSLTQLFGENEAERIATLVPTAGENFAAYMIPEVYHGLKHLAEIRHAVAPKEPKPPEAPNLA